MKFWKLSLLVLFYLLYGFFYAGWFVYDSEFPWIRIQGVQYVALLLTLAIPLIIPPLIWLLVRRVGWRQTIFSLAPVAVLGGLIYAGLAVRYYCFKVRPFDPFLQNPMTRFTVPKQRDPGSFRILTLGGSTTFSEFAFRTKNYPYWLQPDLQRAYPSVHVEVLNGGKSWYTTRHALIDYTTYARDWQPDLVIMMEAINDIVRSFSPPNYAYGSYNDLYTHYYGAAAQGALPVSLEEFEISRFVPLFPPFEWHKALRNRAVDYDLSRYYSLAPFEGNLRKLIHYVRADGPKILLMTQPSLYKSEMTHKESSCLWFADMVASTRVDAFRRQVPSTMSLLRAMRAFNQATTRIAQSEGTDVLEADQAVEKNLTNFVDDVHYTEAGAKTLAEAVAQKIIRTGIVPQVIGASRAAQPGSGRR